MDNIFGHILYTVLSDYYSQLLFTMALQMTLQWNTKHRFCFYQSPPGAGAGGSQKHKRDQPAQHALSCTDSLPMPPRAVPQAWLCGQPKITWKCCDTKKNRQQGFPGWQQSGLGIILHHFKGNLEKGSTGNSSEYKTLQRGHQEHHYSYFSPGCYLFPVNLQFSTQMHPWQSEFKLGPMQQIKEYRSLSIFVQTNSFPFMSLTVR